MNRMEFMSTLEQLLSDISPSEREEAIQYYKDYFDDAGIENEQEVMESLDTPEMVAENIKAGLAEGAGIGEFTENGYQNTGYDANKAVAIRQEHAQQEQDRNTEQGTGYAEGANNQTQGAKKEEKSGMSGGTIALIIILCILASPVIVSLAAAVFGVIIGILATILGLFIGFFASGVALIISAIALAGVGIAKMIVAPFAGIALLGGAMLCAGVGILLLMASVWFVSSLLPAFVQAISYIISKLFGRKAVKSA